MGDLVSVFRVLVRPAQQNWPEVRTMTVIVPSGSELLILQVESPGRFRLPDVVF
jgi:hypothetical protein